MRRLTDRAYWDAKYTAQSDVDIASQERQVGLVRRLFGTRGAEYMRHYPDYVLWDALYSNYLPRSKGNRVLEVGSAPGEHLLQLSRIFGYDPYGVEYSRQGVEVNRHLFAKHGLNPANVIHADFLSPGFQDHYKECFDIVVSRGLIEHFVDLEQVIAAHLHVLRVGGHLVVSVPNLRGINHALTYFFNKATLSLHNLSIMRRATFCRLFDREELSSVVCRYYGTFSFGIFNTSADSPKRHIRRVCAMSQNIINLVLRTAFGTRGPDHQYLSPYLIFVGIKKR